MVLKKQIVIGHGPETDPVQPAEPAQAVIAVNEQGPGLQIVEGVQTAKGKLQEVTKMKKLDQIYEGKAKKVIKTEDPNLLIVETAP